MWWRLVVLTGLFYGASHAFDEGQFVRRAPCRVFYNGENGHYYQWTPLRGLNWHEARRLAGQHRLAGEEGHLATITSGGENDFLSRHNDGHRQMWIAATDSEEEGTWKWAAGPESGDTFYKVGGPQPEGGYHDFYKDEPNNQAGSPGDRVGEDYAIWGFQGTHEWNDVHEQGDYGGVAGLLIEYSNLPSPERLLITAGNTHFPFYVRHDVTIVGERDGMTWQWR